jgi:heme/copper-type cytochrome/quinol oxidase subunit 2
MAFWTLKSTPEVYLLDERVSFLSIPFGIAHGQEDAEALIISGVAVIIGFALLAVSLVSLLRARSALGNLDNPKRSAKQRRIILAVLGTLLIVGGIGYGQLRQNQIDEIRRTEMEEMKERQRKEQR